MRFFQKKGGIEQAPEPEVPKVKDVRAAPGASATLSNVGPERGQALDDEDMHIFEGTSSGMGLRGKPKGGSREGQIR